MAEKELKEVKEKANNLSEKKVDNFLINLRKYEQTLPTNDSSFKERAKSYTNQKLLYYLLLFVNMSN